MALPVFGLLYVALGVVVVGLVLVLVVIRSTLGKGVGPDEDEDAPTLLERAQEVGEPLPPAAREDFRRWLDSRWPSPRTDDYGESITR